MKHIISCVENILNMNGDKEVRPLNKMSHFHSLNTQPASQIFELPTSTLNPRNLVTVVEFSGLQFLQTPLSDKFTCDLTSTLRSKTVTLKW